MGWFFLRDLSIVGKIEINEFSVSCSCNETEYFPMGNVIFRYWIFKISIWLLSFLPKRSYFNNHKTQEKHEAHVKIIKFKINNRPA